MAIDTSAAALQRHAHDLAKGFDVRLIESNQLKPDEALGISGLRVALCSTVIDETTYAVALHEIGHLAAPLGIVRNQMRGDHKTMLRIEEDAAWTWARHYALIWTPVMDAVARWAENTYAVRVPPTPAAPAPVAPTTPPPRINWNDFDPQAPVAPKRIDWKDGQ